MQKKAVRADRETIPESGQGASVVGQQLLAGFLAGASEVVGIVLFVAVLLFVGTLGPFLYTISSGLRGQIAFWPAMGDLVAQSFGRLPAFIWTARWAIIGLGILGLLLSLAVNQAARLNRPWRSMLSLVVALGIIGTIVFALQYSNREVLLTWLAGQPYLLTMQKDFLLSDAVSLVVALALALTATYVIWGLWRWWFVRWSRWLGLRQDVTPEPEAATPTESWQAQQARLHRSKRGLLADEPVPEPVVSVANVRPGRLWILPASLLGVTLAVFGAVAVYNLSGSQLSGGDIFVSTQSPAQAVALNFDRPPRQAFISSINGQGVVDITIGDQQQTSAARSVSGMQLTEFGTNAPPTTVDLNGLSPGRYNLTVVLRTGSGGQVRYTTLDGGGTVAQLASWLIGLTAGIWLVLAALTLLELLTARGWFRLHNQ